MLDHPRKAQKAVEDAKKMEPVYVPESLPFGTESMDTQNMTPEELDLAAAAFHVEEPVIPEAPKAASLYLFNPHFRVKCFGFWDSSI